MRLIANRQLAGDYGRADAGQTFEASAEVARSLIERGLARPWKEPKVLYETKVITPEAPEVSARPPFRNVPVSDAEPAPVAPAGDPVLPRSDVSKPRTAHPGRWGRRSR